MTISARRLNRQSGAPVLWLTVAALALAACGGGTSANPVRLVSPSGSPTLLLGEQIEGGVIITPNAQPMIDRFPTQGWRTDFSRHTVPYSQISSGGPPKDGIPAIDRPVFAPFGEADGFLAADEPVMALQIAGDARGYPLQILVWHEIVNDIVGGEPVVVTYCPLCNTALAFKRTFMGQMLDFGTTGNLRFSDLVMYDRQTETWWQQITGEGIVGRYAGEHLEYVPSSIVSYADFKESYPAGRVLSRQTGYNRAYGVNPYLGYDSAAPFLFDGPADGRLPPMERVVSVALDGDAAAYPFPVLEKEKAVNDQVGGRPVVVLYKPGTKSALDADLIKDSREVGAGVVFARELNGRILTFAGDGNGFVDKETGSRWTIAGRAASGPLEGAQLGPVVHGNHFWFAWAVFRPDTRVYGGH